MLSIDGGQLTGMPTPFPVSPVTSVADTTTTLLQLPRSQLLLYNYQDLMPQTPCDKCNWRIQ